MKPLPQFWKALDELPGAATDRRDWRTRLGAEFALSQRYLRKTGDLASAIDCPSPGGDGCPRDVIRLPSGTFRAVCRSLTGQCDPLDLTRDDLAILQVDRHRLQKEVAAAFGLPPPPEPISRWRVSHLGKYGVAAGLGAPVLLVVPGPGRRLDDADFRQGGLGSERAVILVPTNSSLTPSAGAYLSAQKHLVLSLAEISGMHPERGLALLQPAEVLLHELRSALLARIRATAPGPSLNIPAGTEWEEVILTLTSGATLSYSVRGVSRQLDPGILGMRSAKNSNPTLAWTLFVTLVAEGGVLRIVNQRTRSAVMKQKETLARHLRTAFGIETDPFPWDTGEHAYVARFICRDERSKREREVGTARVGR